MIFCVPNEPKITNVFFFKKDMITFGRVKKQFTFENLSGGPYESGRHGYPLVGPTNLCFWED